MPLQRRARILCPSPERREWNDSVSCREQASRLNAQSTADSLRILKPDASRLADDIHCSKAAPQTHSPTLMRLRHGSVFESDDVGGGRRATRIQSNIEAKQRLLSTMHQTAKSSLVVGRMGGGVTMWPGMDDMRLSQRETVQLTAVAVCLVVGSMCLFHYMHGVWHHLMI